MSFSDDNDLSIVFSNKPLEELLCFCKKINIHSNKKTKEFTQETCIETIYYFRATKQNKLYEKIVFNQMMREICISFLDYLDERKKIKFTMKEFINKKYLNKAILEKISYAFYKNEPIQYFVLDNFIDEKFYKEVEKEFIDKNNNFNVVDQRKNHFISNKSIIEN